MVQLEKLVLDLILNSTQRICYAGRFLIYRWSCKARVCVPAHKFSVRSSVLLICLVLGIQLMIF